MPKNEIKFKVSARYIFDVDVIIPGNLKYCELSTGKQKNMSLSSENGASSRLTFLPLADFGFHMNKQYFIDAIYISYDLPIRDAPTISYCGDPYSANYCLRSETGDYVILLHNTARDASKALLEEICKDVGKEPALLPVTGE